MRLLVKIAAYIKYHLTMQYQGAFRHAKITRKLKNHELDS